VQKYKTKGKWQGKIFDVVYFSGFG